MANEYPDDAIADALAQIHAAGSDCAAIDALANTFCADGNAAGLRALLDVGHLGPEHAKDAGELRYMAISWILSDNPEEHLELVTDWMKAVDVARPDIAARLLCDTIIDAEGGYSSAAVVYKCCASVGMDMHRLTRTSFHKMGESALTTNRHELTICTPFSALICCMPVPMIRDLILDRTIQLLDRVPTAGMAPNSERVAEQINILEFFGRFNASYLRMDQMLSILDARSSQVQRDLASSIATLVKESDMRESDGRQGDTFLKIAAMINAGADHYALAASMESIDAGRSGHQRNILHILVSADPSRFSNTVGPRYEVIVSAIEKLTQSVPPDLARTFEFDVNADSGSGKTPLHLAACKAAPEVVELLLAAGADHTAKMSDGATPEDQARSYGRKDVVAMLRSWAARQSIQSVIDRALASPN